MIDNIITPNLNKYLHVHADCIPVSGAHNMALYDLTRSKINFFPSSYFQVFKYAENHKLSEIIQMFEDKEDIENFKEFTAYLIENDNAIFLEDKSNFPPIQKKWDSPSIIVNSIIDIDQQKHDFESIFNQLDSLGCQQVQLRFYSMDMYDLRELNELIGFAYNTSISGIELLIKHHEKFSDPDYISLLEKNPLIASFIVHSATKTRNLVSTFGYDGQFKELVRRDIQFTTQNISSCSHCGIINKKSLVISDPQMFMENALYNGCLNRKISVDVNGDIKNCPSLPTNYGNIVDTTLSEVILREDYLKWGKIKKDDISECQDCELRYACTDCRAYTVGDKIDTKPKKCNYNPYEGVWK